MKTPLRILHIEDNVRDAELVADLLHEGGFVCKITRVESREEFSRILTEKRFDLILSDFTLPSFDGLSALRIARETCPDTPFIFVSATIGEEAAIQSLLYGATDYVLKNKMERLVPAVQRAVKEVEEKRNRKSAEETLRRNEETFRLLFASNPHPMWVYDLETLKFLKVNDATISKYGYSLDEFLTMRISDIRPQEDVPRLLEDMRRDRGDVDHTTGWRHKLKNGNVVEVEITSHTLKFSGRDAVLVVAQDVTQRKQAEEKLRESENRYRQVVESASDIIYTTDESGRFLEANAAALRVVEYSLDELRQLTYQDLILPEYRKQVARAYQRQLLRKESTSYIEFPFRIKSGVTRWFGQNASLSIQDGKIIGFNIIARDITKRKLAEEALRESEDRYRNLIETMNDGLLQVSNDDVIMFVNKRFCEMVGYTAHELIGKVASELFLDEEQRKFVKERNKVREKRIANHYEIQLKKKSGVTFWVRVSGSPVFDVFGNIIGSVGIHSDITEQKRSEKLQQALYRVAQAAHTSTRMDDLFGAIHLIVKEIMPAENFYIALYDEKDDLLRFPYFADEVDLPSPPSKPGKGLTEYVLRTGKALLCDEHTHDVLIRKGEAELVGAFSPIWLGVPLIIEKKTIGVMVVQHYKNPKAYGEHEKEMLGYVSSQVAKAIERKKAEEKLKKSEASLAEAQRIAKIGSWEWNVLDDTATWSDEMYRILGLPQSGGPLSVRAFIAMLDPDERSHVQKAVNQTLQYHVPYNIEIRFARPDKTECFVHARAENVTDKSGKVLKLVGTLQDITERKQAGDELSQRARLAELDADIGVELTRKVSLREMLQHCAEAIVNHLHAAFARIWTLNEAERVLELQASAAMYTHLDGPHGRVPVGKFKIGLIAEERKPHMTNSVVGDPRVGDQEWAKREGMVSFARYPLMVEGRLVGVAAMFSRKPLSEATFKSLGSVAGSIALGIERKKAEEATKESQAWLNAIFDASRDGIVVEDNEIIAYANKSYATLHAYELPSELVGRHISVAQSAEDNERLLQFGERRLRGEATPSRYEFKGKRKDGMSIDLEASVSTVVIGRKQYIITLVRDISERKQLETQLRQAQKMESLGTLAGGIAHDFNNILGIIMAHSTLVERGKSSVADFAESIKSITKATQRGANLVKQLLTFARKSDVVLESVRLNETVREVVKLLSQTLPKTITIETKLAQSLPSVTADATQMHQVLLNLCVNARDAMPKGGTLSIETAVTPGGSVRNKIPGANASDYVQVRVKDTGTGMDEETRARIFEPFFTTKELGKGTGLGLATAFGIVQTHKGFIDVESQTGKGTTFFLYLPVQQRSLEPEELKSEQIEQIRGGTETVLLIEDEEDLLKTSTLILNSRGYSVISARDGVEGIQVYAENKGKITLVVCDLGLPKLDGSVVFSSLKGINPNVKFILASGFVDPDMKSELFKSGMKEFIQKPYLPDVLLRKVREVLDAEF